MVTSNTKPKKKEYKSKSKSKPNKSKKPKTKKPKTKKPKKLLQRIIELTTDENDWVLDPVAGAGTTGHSCIELKRNCTLIDKNRDSFEIMIKRIEKLSSPE